MAEDQGIGYVLLIRKTRS